MRYRRALVPSSSGQAMVSDFGTTGASSISRARAEAMRASPRIRAAWHTRLLRPASHTTITPEGCPGTAEGNWLREGTLAVPDPDTTHTAPWRWVAGTAMGDAAPDGAHVPATHTSADTPAKVARAMALTIHLS